MTAIESARSGSSNGWSGFARRAALVVLAAPLVVAPPAQAQSVLSMLANSMNRELPRAFGNRTRLVKVSAKDDTLDFEFQVAPDSPLAKGVDLKREAAALCKVEMFRSLMTGMKARLHVAYSGLDRSPLGEFAIDRSICRL